MAYGTRAGFAPLQSVAAGSITGSYAALGNPFPAPIRLLYLGNGTDHNVLISFDGSDDHVLLVSGTFQLFDLCTNRVENDGFFLPEGTQPYIKNAGASPTTGSVWTELIYATAGGV